MSAVKATWKNGQVLLESQADWPDGCRLIVAEAPVRAYDPVHGAAQTLADFLGQHVGVLSSKTVTDSEGRLSEQSGRKFTEALLRKHRESSL